MSAQPITDAAPGTAGADVDEHQDEHHDEHAAEAAAAERAARTEAAVEQALAAADATEALIARAEASDRQRTVTAAARARRVLDDLRARVAEEDARAREDRERQARREELRDREDALNDELARIRAELRHVGGARAGRAGPASPARLRVARPPSDTTGAGSGLTPAALGTTPQQVRAWAASQDLQVPAYGRIPGWLMTRYAAAHRNDATEVTTR